MEKLKIKIGEIYYGKISKGINENTLIIQNPTDFKTKSLLLMSDLCHVEFEWLKGAKKGLICGNLTHLCNGSFHFQLTKLVEYSEIKTELNKLT